MLRAVLAGSRVMWHQVGGWHRLDEPPLGLGRRSKSNGDRAMRERAVGIPTVFDAMRENTALLASEDWLKVHRIRVQA